MSRATRNIWMSCLGAVMLALGVQAGTTPAGAPAKTMVKPDSAELATRKAAVEASSDALSAKAEAAAADEKKRSEKQEARRKAKLVKKNAASKDAENIRKSDEKRAKARAKELKQELVAAAKARKAERRYTEPGSAPESDGASPSETKKRRDTEP